MTYEVQTYLILVNACRNGYLLLIAGIFDFPKITNYCV